MLEAFQEEIGSIDFLPGVTADTNLNASASGRTPNGFRRPREMSVYLAVRSGEPAAAQQERSFQVYVSRDRDEHEVFLLATAELDYGTRFALWEVFPELSTAAKLRLSALARKVIHELISLVATSGTSAFKKSEYSPLPPARTTQR